MLTSTQPRQGHVRIPIYDRWIVLIGVLKLLEAALFVLLGVGVFRLLHKDLVVEVWRLLAAMRFDPEGRFSSFLLEKAALISPVNLEVIGAAALAHASIDIVEGVGLILRRIWAEFVTVVVSAMFLPLEFFEIARHVTRIRVGVTVVNVVVVVYLIFHVQMRLRERRALAMHAEAAKGQ